MLSDLIIKTKTVPEVKIQNVAVNLSVSFLKFFKICVTSS